MPDMTQESCPKAPRRSEWHTTYENGIPIHMIWLGPQPLPPHELVTLLYGYQRCVWCGEISIKEPSCA